MSNEREEFARMLHWRDQCLWTHAKPRVSFGYLSPSVQQKYREEADNLLAKAASA